MAIMSAFCAYISIITMQEAIFLADSLRKQALVLTLGNVLTRGMGFMLHLILARRMGAEALGVMEMANSVGMLALTPVTAGIPSAISRLAARRPACDRPNVLRAGLRLVQRIALALTPALLLLSPFLSWLLGDQRTLPAIVLCAPDILLLGMGSVYCGYCYACGSTRLPALTECAEQLVRMLLCAALLYLLPHTAVAVTAALPGLAEALAALVVVVIFRRRLPLQPSLAKPSAALQKDIWRLAAPTTLSRLCTTGMRMLSAVLLPVCLQRSGLSSGAAAAQLGLLNGMALPMMMLPGVATGALCMVATPAISRQERQPARMRRTARLMMLSAFGIGAAAALALFFLADFISLHLYRQPALAPLVRFMCPMCVLLAVHQVQCGLIAGRGLQKQALRGSIAANAATLLLTALLAIRPQWRLFGAAAAIMLGHIISVIYNIPLAARPNPCYNEEKIQKECPL